ncbi:hypothetical protein NY551_18895 [Curtobacterium flaccumfaciens pv. oortii]|uniref:hypothetical protein n=1 Tax=Curtobacterium flaccumfaciens TaxID=2035 RepID=UPI002659D10A|nr:hypothetical protein [Curtobacterium flaccumfaciens]MCS5524808.1 hypothetical protein [Curtobacterium flaccumfaciens pv. oortii]
MSSPATEQLARLAEVRDEIAAAEAREKDLRSTQREQLEEALGAGATVAEVVEASGLSRAYLHRVDVPLYTPQTTHARVLRKSGDLDPAGPREAALVAARQLRDEIELLRAETETQRKERSELTVAIASDRAISRAAIEAAAGVSSEWIRKQIRAAENRTTNPS